MGEMMERTLVLLKPDAVERGLIGRIISRFEAKALKIVGIKMMRISPEISKEHYAHHLNKPFYKALEKFITSRPIVAMAVEGPEAVEVVRKIVGATNGRKAEPGTIRGDFSISTSTNLIHASDSRETAEKEIKRFFKKEELFDYEFSWEWFREAEDER
ncbi:MAG: nucleoside-diphosphate kinase [Candidatus Anstonellales archaeon]